MGFSDAEAQTPDQLFTLTAKEYTGDIGLKYVKFQHVDKVTIFIEDNYGAPQTEIQKLEIWGCPAKGTNVGCFSGIFCPKEERKKSGTKKIVEGVCEDPGQDDAAILIDDSLL